MSRVSDVTNQAIKNLLAFYNVTKATLAINAAGAATIKSTGAINYVNNGIFLQKAALAAQAITPNVPGGLKYIQPANTTVYYTVGLDGAGNVYVAQGSYVGQQLSLDPTLGIGVSQAGTSWVGDGSVPDFPDALGVTPIGILKVALGATTFNPGTTLLDAANVTVTYFDISVLPAGKP